MKETGINLIEFRIRWNEFETSPGNFNFSAGNLPAIPVLKSSYPDLLQGLIIMAKVIETSVRTLPDDLSGKPFNDPEILARFDAVTDGFSKQSYSKDVTQFLIGQEVDTYITLNTNELDTFDEFLEHATGEYA